MSEGHAFYFQHFYTKFYMMWGYNDGFNLANFGEFFDE